MMEELISFIELLARQFYVEKRKYYTFTNITGKEREDVMVFWISENNFSDNEQVVLDHYHYTYNFPWVWLLLRVTLKEKQRRKFQKYLIIFQFLTYTI